MYAVFLTLELLCMFPLLAVVDLQRVVVAGYDGKLASVVEVEGCDGGGRITRFEFLDVVRTDCILRRRPRED